MASEVEEPTGLCIGPVCFLVSRRPGDFLFAPGPRGPLDSKGSTEAIYDLHPILHVNEAEANWLFLGCREIQPAIEYLYQRTGQLIIVTLGENGAVAHEATGKRQECFPTEVVDTVGAGDSHVGSLQIRPFRRIRYDASLKVCQSL